MAISRTRPEDTTDRRLMNVERERTISPEARSASQGGKSLVDPGRSTGASSYTTPQYVVNQSIGRTSGLTTPQTTPQTVPQTPALPPVSTPAGSLYEDPRLNALIDKLTSNPYDAAYTNMMTGQLREQLMNTAAAARSEMANRLGASGVEGGLAMDYLGDVDREAARGMASGVTDILRAAMEQSYTDRLAALQALQGLSELGTTANLKNAELALQGQLGNRGLDIQQLLGGRELDIRESLGKGQLDLDKLLGTRRLDLEEKLSQGQLDLDKLLGTRRLDVEEKLGQGQLDLDKLLGTRRLDIEEFLGTTDRQLALEEMNLRYGLQTREDQINLALNLLQLAQSADAEESARLMELVDVLILGG